MRSRKTSDAPPLTPVERHDNVAEFDLRLALHFTIAAILNAMNASIANHIM